MMKHNSRIRKVRSLRLSGLMVLTFLPLLLFSQAKDGLVGDWTFHPNYTLKHNASNYPGQKIDPPKSRFERFKIVGAPIRFYGQNPTERLTDFLESKQLPNGEFSIELWMLNHVNMPVGAMMCSRNNNQGADWLLGYYGKEAVFSLNAQGQMASIVIPVEGKRKKKYWGHLVATYDGNTMKVFLDGKEIKKQNVGQRLIGEDQQLELAGYFGNEPYMKVSNLVKGARLYNRALSSKEINSRLNELMERVEKGKLFEGIFHFNAGPYLHYSTQHSINISWETDRLSTAVVEYGTNLSFTSKKELTKEAYIHEVTLDGLDPETLYYYQVTVIDQSGKEMKSGVLTFGTAVKETSAFSFNVIGDTESRPHINHRLGDLMWEERPNFLMHLGDVTDGGFKDHKFEWNYEYFTGITPVTSRIPIFPVAGNGESDLYWYNRYHKLPDPEAYYSFTYGNAEFFMLNSNEKKELIKGGIQYEWLRKKLSESKARWKFVVHHHCPVSSDENDYGDTWKGESSNNGDPRFDDLKRLYEAMGVDVVFYGHVHAYERSWPVKEGNVDWEEGVVYIQSGGGGGHLEDFTPTRNTFTNKLQRGNHYLKVDVSEHLFSMKMYDTEGRMKDFLELKKDKPND